VTTNATDRYKFRSSPLRNVSLQPAFFHNGAFTRLEDAMPITSTPESARNYDPVRAGVDHDLTFRRGPVEPVVAKVDPLLLRSPNLTPEEFNDLVAFRPNRLARPTCRSHAPVLADSGCAAERHATAAVRGMSTSSLLVGGYAHAIDVALCRDTKEGIDGRIWPTNADAS
jgi:hypothetical protein